MRRWQPDAQVMASVRLLLYPVDGGVAAERTVTLSAAKADNPTVPFIHNGGGFQVDTAQIAATSSAMITIDQDG